MNIGPNTLTFNYSTLSDSNHAAFQGPGDEGWGVEQVNVGTVSSVPELSTWSMMIFGFAGLGFMAYGRKSRPKVVGRPIDL